MERGTENTCMNVRAFSLRVKQKANSPKVVSKETVLNESLVQTKKNGSPWEATSHGSVTVIVWPEKFPSSRLIKTEHFSLILWYSSRHAVVKCAV